VFKIKEREFEIHEARISATILDPYWYEMYGTEYDHKYFWSINVSANNQVFGSYSWAPDASHEDLLLSIRNWHDLENTVYEWKKPEGCFTVFGNENITEACIIIGKRKGNKFELSWKGLCDIHWNEEYSENVPFEIECEATFCGAGVNASEKDTDETVLERVSQFFDIHNLKQLPLEQKSYKYQSGVGIASSVFLPKIENNA